MYSRSKKTSQIFAGLSETNLQKKAPILQEICGNVRANFFGKKPPILWEFLGKILLESDRFCTDLTNISTKKRYKVKSHVACDIDSNLFIQSQYSNM